MEGPDTESMEGPFGGVIVLLSLVEGPGTESMDGCLIVKDVSK